MSLRRTLPMVALIAVAMLGLAACVAINETVAERDFDCRAIHDDLCLRVGDLDCGGVQDDLCVRVVELVISPAGGLDRVPVPPLTVRVNPIDCVHIGRGPMEGRVPVAPTHAPARRCWRIEGEDSTGAYWFGRWVYENDDGILRATG